MAEPRSPRGLIDTSVVIDLPDIELNRLPVEIAISAVTLAELAAGPHATSDSAERAKRQDRLQRAEATFEPLPVDASVARAYGRVYAAIVASGRKARGRRAVESLRSRRRLSRLVCHSTLGSRTTSEVSPALFRLFRFDLNVSGGALHAPPFSSSRSEPLQTAQPTSNLVPTGER